MKTRLLVVNLTSFLKAIEGRYPRCDFNSLNIKQLMAHIQARAACVSANQRRADTGSTL